MPLCGDRFDENGVHAWTRGTSGGLGVGKPTHPGAALHPSDGGDFQAALRRHVR